MLKRNNVTRAMTRGSALVILSTAGLLMPLTRAKAQSAPEATKAVESKPDAPAAEVAPAPEAEVKGKPTPTAEAGGTAPATPAAAPVAPGAPPAADAPVTPGVGPAVPGAPVSPGAAGAPPAPTPESKALPQRVQTAQAQATIRELEARIAKDEAALARDYAQLQAAQRTMQKITGYAVSALPMEVYTQVLPDGRVITQSGRGPMPKNDAPNSPLGVGSAPDDAKDRDQRLSEIEHRLQVLLNEVDKMRDEKPEIAPEISPPPTVPAVR